MSALPDIDLDAAMAVIGQISASDAAQCASLAHRLKKAAPALVAMLEANDQARSAVAPFPPLPSITAIECAIFDNWIAHGGKRPAKGHKGRNATRLTAVLKIWTIPAKEINFASQKQCRKFEVHLLDGAELAAKAKKVSRSHPDLSTSLCELSAFDGQFLAAGIRMSKPHGSGTIYHLDHFFMLRTTQTPFEGVIVDIQNKAPLALAPFDTKDASKRPLKGNVSFQSRYSPDPRLSNWMTVKSLLISG